MNKKELVAAVADSAGLEKSAADSAVDAVLEQIAAAVAGGEKVSLAGFGTFEARERAARSGRNPQTGESIEIAATRAPAFKPASQLKSRVAAS